MKQFEATGRTVEEAISSGLASSGLSIGEVSVEILEEGSKGLFGLFGSRTARVRLTRLEEETVSGAHDVFKDSLRSFQEKPAVQPSPAKVQKERSPKEPVPPQKAKPVSPPPRVEKPRDPEAAEPAKESGKKPARSRKPREKAATEAILTTKTETMMPPREPAAVVQADPQTPEGIAQVFLQELTALMGIKVSVAVSRDEDGNVLVQMDGDTQGILIGRRGETLDALQYLTSLKVNRGREEYIRVTLDSEGYRKKREEALIRLANRMANRAKKTGRSVSMEPMNPYERRIFHSALQACPGISTHSEGEEPNRHVIITPSKKDGSEVSGSNG